MPPIVLVSDTHMCFDMLARIAQAEQAASILHAGDLGLFDAGSWDRISGREQRLIVKHGNPMEQAVAWTEGRRRLPAPMVAVPGNHEDYDVVARVEAGRWPIPGFTLLTPGMRVPCLLGDRRITVMGLGRVARPHADESAPCAASQITAAHIQALEESWDDVPPDIFLLHEPVHLWGGPRGEFGSDLISRIIGLLEPRLVVMGHMHFPYRLRWGPSLLVGLGYGVKGQYAVLDESFEVHHRDITGRPVRLEEVEVRGA